MCDLITLYTVYETAKQLNPRKEMNGQKVNFESFPANSKRYRLTAELVTSRCRPVSEAATSHRKRTMAEMPCTSDHYSYKDDEDRNVSHSSQLTIRIYIRYLY